MDGFNSELEGVEENSVSPDMDIRLAFAVQDVPSEALAFSLLITRWAKAVYKRSPKLDKSHGDLFAAVVL